MDIHPKQLEAQRVASERQQKRQKMQDYVKAAKARGVRFTQINNTVIAYVRRLQIVHFSTAIRAPKDPFDILIGRSLAAHRLENGEFTTLRMRPKITPQMFFSIIEHYTS